MTRRERSYNRKIQELIDKVGRLEDREVKRVLKILDNTRKDIASAVISSEWQAYHLPELKEAVNQATEAFKQQYMSGHKDAIKNFWNVGIDMIDAPLAYAGVIINVPEISQALFEVMQGYSVDLISGLSADAMKKINNEITLAVMGRKPAYEVMKTIGRNIKDKNIIAGIGRRAEVITRTELSRIQSTARAARTKALTEGTIDPPLKLEKKWISSGKANPRQTHAALHGVTVPVDQDFPGGLPYPHAPELPAEEVINCGCTHVVTTPDWETLPKKFDRVPYEYRGLYN